ncbi:MAG: hypothetical protein LH473_05590 [Chitinophagales bacterium]|nr:hypothetical protein [Chitinophagales bacterium]
MKTHRIFILLSLICLFSCTKPNHTTSGHEGLCSCDSSANRFSSDTAFATVQEALLGTRFKSFDELKSVVNIKYINNNTDSDSTIEKNSKVCIRQCSNGKEVVAVLESGINQGEISDARNGNFWVRLNLLIKSPYAVSKRAELSKVYLLARRRTELYGEGDPAFYDLAQNAAKNINTADMAFKNMRDSTEKGYINSFNHITSQAIITSCFSEKLADFIGDSHERYFHPELITGKFTEDQISDLDEGPVDNYVDVINNMWGQKIGKELKKKYHITRKTLWTPEFLVNYLNDLQSYYSWAFQIGFKPVKPEDELVIRFSKKMNLVIHGVFKLEKI